jgi:sugar (pentulose or hexulose) kinase
MATADVVIGVDIGTQSTKAILCDAQGRIVAQHAQGYAVDAPQPGWAQQWPAVWLDACAACIRGVVARSGVTPQSIRALGISSLGGGSGVPVNASGAALHPCLIWMDRRATREAEFVNAHLDAQRLRAITGNGVDSFYGFTKMMWLRDHEPQVWARTRYLLPPNSWVNAQLTGQVAVDHSAAGNIGAIYDIAQRAWSHEGLAMVGIPASMMPERLLQSSEIVGSLLPEWASRLALPAGLPVVAGGVDAAAATLAAGATRPGNHVAMLGTSMCWGTIRQRVDAAHGLVSFPHVFNALEDIYVFGGAMTAGGAVTWFRDTFCQAEIAQAQAEGIDVHVLLDRAAARLPASRDALLFLPYLMGERSPVWDANASGAFIGIGLQHGRAHLYRAVLEGIAFALRHTIDAGALGAEAIDPQLVVVGGVSRSDLCMQIVADVCGRPVYTFAEDVEAPLGAAMLAALGVGLLDADGVRKGWARPVQRAAPRADVRDRYEALYEQYRAAYPALRPVMHGLRERPPA